MFRGSNNLHSKVWDFHNFEVCVIFGIEEIKNLFIVNLDILAFNDILDSILDSVVDALKQSQD